MKSVKVLALIITALTMITVVQSQSIESTSESTIHASILDIHNDSSLRAWYEEYYQGSMNFSAFKAWTMREEKVHKHQSSIT